MKLAVFEHDGRRALGVVIDTEVVDVDEAFPEASGDWAAVIASSTAFRERVARAVDRSTRRHALSGTRLCAPLRRPGKFMALGLNYTKHVEESRRLRGLDQLVVKDQVWFSKQISCINGPNDPLVKPAASDAMDYEAELAFVIGERCRGVSAKDAHRVIAGYLCANDVSMRDWQVKTTTLTVSKSADTAGPIGPWIVTSDAIADPQNLRIQSWVNGEKRQDSYTSDMIFTCFQMVEHLSCLMTFGAWRFDYDRHTGRRRHGIRPASLLAARRHGRRQD